MKVEKILGHEIEDRESDLSYNGGEWNQERYNYEKGFIDGLKYALELIE
jgi:hypothetical protein